jgi:hypothetical protein
VLVAGVVVETSGEGVTEATGAPSCEGVEAAEVEFVETDCGVSSLTICLSPSALSNHLPQGNTRVEMLDVESVE